MAAEKNRPLALKQPHFPARAKRVIFLCMEGAPSHMDTFDYKPVLKEQDGKPLPNPCAPATAKLMGSPWSFKQYGECGHWVSELFPEVATCADDLCILRSMQTDVPAHPQAFAQLRIGIIGTSYGGGLATWTAANDPRVKCAAVQVPGMGGGKTQAAERRAYQMMTQQARGETEPVPFEQGAPGGKMSSYAHMRYNTAKGIGFDAIKAAEKINVPMLIIDAEKEELMNIAENGQRVADILKANKVDMEYQVIPGIGHYGVYAEKFKEVTELEIAWFENHLKTSLEQK
jgi:dienelactone hydrolase